MFQGNLHPALRVVPDTANRQLEQYNSAQQLTPSQSPGRQGSGSSSHRFLAPPTPASATTDVGQQNGRTLPSREVTDDNFDDAYVSFIMYCNPSIPPDTDTSELRKIFRAPPKSDNKTFNTFNLFELIQKFEAKEIKTWAQLVEDLGVEKPSFEKKQSAQKVQQYAVRLKRWMHAMHVDAFFEYLNDKLHVYWTQVPAIDDSASIIERDGVAAEEDLALRALLPETRPKRGRRKAEDREENDMGKSPSQRPRVGSPTLSEEFMIARSSLIADNTTPATAHPDFRQGFSERMAPWSAADVRGTIAQSFRWPPDNAQTPLSAYPQSALTPTMNRGMWNEADEPRSAITPKSRSRRRHGPAVSSAWPSNGSVSSGKLRGRPPSNRNLQDGPFSTFPVNPGSRDATTNHLRDNTPVATPIVADPNIPQFFAPEMATNPPNPPQQNLRPSRLSLQVPERQGGAVRLATPPPVVLVNGEDNTNIPGDELTLNGQHSIPLMEYFFSPNMQDPNVQNFVSIAFRQNEEKDRTNMDALESHFICEILAADWHDASGASIERCTIDEADKICKQVIKNLQAESSSTETFLINLSALAGGPLMTRLRMTRLEQGSICHYECHWKMRFGSIEADFTIRATVQHVAESDALEEEAEDSEESWKQRYLDLQQEIKCRDEKVGNLKRDVLHALVASNQFSSI